MRVLDVSDRGLVVIEVGLQLEAARELQAARPSEPNWRDPHRLAVHLASDHDVDEIPLLPDVARLPGKGKRVDGSTQGEDHRSHSEAC